MKCAGNLLDTDLRKLTTNRELEGLRSAVSVRQWDVFQVFSFPDRALKFSTTSMVCLNLSAEKYTQILLAGIDGGMTNEFMSREVRAIQQSTRD